MIRAAPAKEVETAWFDNQSNAKYTTEDYRTAVGLIANSPYHAVQKVILQAELEKGDRLKEFGRTGADIVEFMIEENVLSLRPYSKLAKDIPREAFVWEIGNGLKIRTSVVVMPSPAHLYEASIFNKSVTPVVSEEKNL